jgi:adiponectin receptor
MGFTVAMGVIGMILPFQPFFDRPESKGIRITFFVSMACSALIPQAHMSYLYGLNNTFNFYCVWPLLFCHPFFQRMF